MNTIWLSWKDLTEEEKEQAKISYVSIRAEEEQRKEKLISSDNVVTCSFERMEDGYIFVNI